MAEERHAERAGPPEALRRRMWRRLPSADREVAMEELDDLWHLRRDRLGVEAADRWYRRELLRFPARLWTERVRRGWAAAIRSAWTMGQGGGGVDALIRDFRYALRRLGRSRGFSAVAILSLALGIGANTAMFSVVNAVLLVDPPFRDGDQLVDLYTSDLSGTLYGTWSHPDILDLEERSEGVFSGVAASRTFVAAVGEATSPEVVVGEAVTANHFEVLGVPMHLGRAFGPEEDGPIDSAPVAILNHGTWLREFGGDPRAIGRPWRINGLDYEIVGVAPEWYTGSFPAFRTGAFVPMNMIRRVMGQEENPLEARGNRGTFVRARRAEGVSVDQANAWLESFSLGMSETYPETNEDRRYTAIATQDILVHPLVDGALVPVAGFLMAIVALVLLIACMNLASFLLARAEQRRREIAVRLSLGAGRSGLIRQLLVETVLLSTLGGLGGLALARGAVDALLKVRPPIPVPLNLDISLDLRVLLFTLGVSVAAGIVFGLVPALQATRPRLAGTLRDESGAVTRGRSRLRGVLVTAQVSLSVVLLVGSGLFLRSLLEAQSADPGVYTGEGAVIWPQLDLSGLTEEEGIAYWAELEERLRGTPGITHVGYTDMMPLGFGVQTTGLRIPGVESNRPDGRIDIDYAWTSPGYFTTMEVPVLSGRGFEDGDGEGERIALVSRAFERAYFPGGAVGRTVDGPGGERRIVGVVADTKVRTIGEDPRPRLYLPDGESYREARQVVTRGTGSSGEILRATVDVALAIDPRVVLMDRRTLDEHFDVHLFPPRMAALLLSIFGGLALLLAAVGIWGVVQHSVAQRTREVGLRVSLGATGGSVIRLMVGSGMRVVAFGVAVGLVLAAGAGTLVAGFLYGVRPLDPVTFIGIPLLLIVVSLGAAWFPARRAAAIDPMKALRTE